jgi:hypothetical protein
MNIGIMLFPAGGREGTLLALEEATAHLSQDNNLRRVDQGPINYRWKFGYRDFKWPRPLFRVKDKTGGRLCGLIGGNVTGAVLPAAQFCNTLTHDVLQLWRAAKVAPFAVHATWMRRQDEPWKLMRLREQNLWHDGPAWYGRPMHPQQKKNPGNKKTSSTENVLGLLIGDRGTGYIDAAMQEDASSWMVPAQTGARHPSDPAAIREQVAASRVLLFPPFDARNCLALAALCLEA